MSLTGTGARPKRSETKPNGWAFDMRDERGDSVQVIVTDLALEALGAAEVSPHAVRAHLADIDRLASIKHTAGHLEKDGSIKVTSADVREAGL